MAEEAVQSRSLARQRRVKRLKRIIVTLFFIVIILPTSLCIYFACVNGGLKKELIRQKEELDFYIEKVSEEQYAETENTASEKTVPVETEQEWKPEEIKPSDAEIENLTLSDEELYDGYRKVYLTFDDGPSANTERILAILREYDVKATFFVVKHEGADFAALYKKIVDEGHSLGMHSRTHVYKDLYNSLESFCEDTDDLRQFLYDTTGVESELYRFPGGSTNRATNVDMRIFAKALKERGIEFFDWNVSSQDATAGGVSKDHIVNIVTSTVSRKREAIILFHDLASKNTTVEALPEIIEYVKSLKDTVFLPITKDTDAIHFITIDE